MNSIISLLGSGSGLRSLGNCLWLCLFGIFSVISVQSPILEITEQNLADHMVIEHTIFFFLGAASVKTAEIILRILVSLHIVIVIIGKQEVVVYFLIPLPPLLLLKP